MAVKKLFSQGYGAVRDEKKRQEERKEAMGKQLWRFFLKEDGDEAEVIFLTEEPITFREHGLKIAGEYKNLICTGEDCPHCDGGDRPSFKSAFLIWDGREYSRTDENGKKKKVSGQLRLFVTGTKLSTQLDRLHNKYGLTSYNWTIARTGEGTQTSYSLERGDKLELDEDEISAMLPEKLREVYDGTEESLYAIVIEQLEMLAEEASGDKLSKSKSKEPSRVKSKSNKRTDDDEDEYEDNLNSNLVGDEDDDDDEDEKPPVKKGGIKSRNLSGGSSKMKSLLRNKK